MQIFINFEAMMRKYAPILLIVSCWLMSCSNKYHRFVSNYHFTAATGVPDYSKLDYWAAHPSKWDPSDSVPRPFRENYHSDTSVD
ncbi:MAG: hypothetical protein ABI581_12095, partial [Sediminibacterium sp.]